MTMMAKKADRNHSNSKRLGNTHNNSSTMRTTNNTTIAATSPAAMGKALVILATSCAALSGQSAIPTAGRTRASHQRGRQPCTTTTAKGGRMHRDGMQSMIALRYRDGDDDQPLDMQAANRGAVASEMDPTAGAQSKVATPSGHRVSTQFFFAPIVRLMPSTPSATSTSIASSKKEDDQQLVMDEYLEFVERRYSRMHPKHHHRQPHGKNSSSTRIGKPKVVLDFHLPRKIFLSTLALHRPPALAAVAVTAASGQQSTTIATASSESPTHATAAGYAAAAARQAKEEDFDNEDKEEEDPLNVLGLSNLASERLRQRLHVPRDLRDEAMLLTSGTTSAVNFFHHCMHLNDHHHTFSSKASSSTANKALVDEAGGRTSHYISLSFTAQFQLLWATLRRITLAFVNTVRIMTAFGSRMFSEILDRGGFRHSLRMMSVASVAILLMFRPLFRGALKQG